MSDVPSWLLRHRVVIEPRTGSGPFGDIYGPPVEVRAFVDSTRRLVRAETGNEVVSETTVIAPLGTVAPTGSRVTLPDGRTAVVIASKARDGGGLPTPDHLEISLT